MNATPMGDPGAPQDTTRLMLTAVMLVTLYGVWSFFLSPKPDPNALAQQGDAGVVDVQPTDPSGAHTPGPATTKPIDPNAPATAAVQPEAPVGGTPSLPEKTVVVEADVSSHPDNPIKSIKGGYRALVTNQGAQIASFQLPGYGDTHALPDPETNKLPIYDVVSDHDESGGMMGLRSRSGDVKIGLRDSWEMKQSDPMVVMLERETAEGVRLTRKYAFDGGRFGFTHELTFKNESDQPKSLAVDIVLNAIYAAGGGSFLTPSVSGDVVSCRTSLDQEGYDMAELKEERTVNVKGGIQYVAQSDQYFMNALLPMSTDQAVGCQASHYVPTSPIREDGTAREGASLSLQLAPVTLQPGEVKTFTQKGYFGPKQLQLLEGEGSQLDENIEFGIFGVLSKPILWLLIKLYDFSGNFGIAIILLTLCIKLLTFPLTQKSYVSMQQMKILAPELKELQAKYAHDRAALGQKQMDLYKEKGINPLAGCFPMLVQMPIWFALYRTLWTSVELYQQPFVSWITDLSQPEVFPLFGFAGLPFVVGALMLYQTSLSPPPQDQPQMKYVLWLMPVMFTFFMFSMPSGLSIYMITNSTLTMAQQLYIKKKYAVPEPDAAKADAAKPDAAKS